MRLDRVIAVRNNKTVFRDGDRCIKVFYSAYSKADVLNEALNQARIEETGLNIPQIIEVTMINGKWAIVSEFIKGKTLAQLMQENPEKKSEYIDLLVELQMNVHAKTCPHINRLKDMMDLKIGATELDTATRCNLRICLESMPKHNKVCHGDFNPSNIIITDDGTAYILDWSDATQGNASADVGRTYLLFLLDGDMHGAEQYLDTFCQKSNTPKQDVQKWMPIVAASQLVKCNEKERQLLMRWANALDQIQSKV